MAYILKHGLRFMHTFRQPAGFICTCRIPYPGYEFSKFWQWQMQYNVFVSVFVAGVMFDYALEYACGLCVWVLATYRAVWVFVYVHRAKTPCEKVNYQEFSGKHPALVKKKFQSFRGLY